MSNLDFIPEVWHSEGFPPMLVCGRRWMHTKPVSGAAIATTYDLISHAVCIQLGNPQRVCFNFTGGGKGSDEVWTRDTPEVFGLNRRAAELALTEAWRCIDLKLDGFTLDAEVKSDLKRFSNYRNKGIDGGGTPRRNIAFWMNWTRWKNDKATKETIIAEVESWGFPFTPKAFNRLLEDAGMSI